MAGDPLAFFTLDHGTASTAAALIAPVGGRFRLLAADVQPAGLPAEALLARLVASATDADPAALADAEGWAAWARLEVATRRPPRLVLVAPDEHGLAAVSAAATGAGWRIAGRIRADRLEAIGATAACLADDVDLLVVAGSDVPDGGERAALPELISLVRAALERRPRLTCLLTGAGADAAEGWVHPRLVLGPAAVPAGPAEPTPLGELLFDLAAETSDRVMMDGRRAFATGIASLAAVLEQRVEGVDVGIAGGARARPGRTGRATA